MCACRILYALGKPILATSESCTSVKGVNAKVSGMIFIVKLEFEMPKFKGWIDRTKKWIVKYLRDQVIKEDKRYKQNCFYKEAKGQREEKCEEVTSSKKLSEEQLQILSLGLSFGLAPKKYPFRGGCGSYGTAVLNTVLLD